MNAVSTKAVTGMQATGAQRGLAAPTPGESKVDLQRHLAALSRAGTYFSYLDAKPATEADATPRLHH